MCDSRTIIAVIETCVPTKLISDVCRIVTAKSRIFFPPTYQSMDTIILPYIQFGTNKISLHNINALSTLTTKWF